MRLRLLGYDIFIQKVEKRVGLHKMLSMVSLYTGVSYDELTGQGRRADIVRARMFYYKLARMSGYTLSEIAVSVNHNHSTVIHQLKKFEDLTDERQLYFDEVLFNEFEDLKSKIL